MSIQLVTRSVKTACRQWVINTGDGCWSLTMKCEDGSTIVIDDVVTIAELMRACADLLGEWERFEAQLEEHARELNEWPDASNGTTA